MRRRKCETAAPGQALGVTAGVFPHQHRSLGLAESLHDQRIVSEQALSLFGGRWIGGNGFPAQGRLDLAKQPGATECGTGHHDTINGVATEDLHDALGRSQIPVADEWNRAGIA